MSFFKNLKEIYRKVSEVENAIYSEKQDYLEIYERNIQLEKEIEERTRELNIANKRMLTLQHIWDMMNASRPLQNVLETIVNSIQGELGYLHCNIIKKCNELDETYLTVLAQSNDVSIKRVNKIINTPLQTRKLVYNSSSIYAQTAKSKEIGVTLDIGGTLKSVVPDACKVPLFTLTGVNHVSYALNIKRKYVFSTSRRFTSNSYTILETRAEPIPIASA